jgi:outer membrane protein OmpA-like peptidoglycan-associated protein
MIKRVGMLFLLAASLAAFEDVSFSARTLGLGGDQAAVSDDEFAFITNPALPARWKRPITALTFTPYQTGRYWVFNHTQPVRGLGVLGGNLLYIRRPGFVDRGSGDADVRFFYAVPLGPYFNLGVSIGNHSMWRSPEVELDAFEDRFGPGAYLSLGGLAFSAKGFSLGFSLDEMNFTFSSPAIFHTGLGWEPQLKKTTALTSLLLAADGGFRFGESEAIKIHLGAESYFFRGVLGLRIGIRYGTDELSGFSPTFGITLRTHRVEKTDLELHYGTALNYGAADSTLILHQLTLSILIGDARKAEKDSILAEQAERAQRLREQALARERDKLRAELEAIKEERSALEQERKDIERLRHEALVALGRLKGIEFTENDTFTRVTIQELALRFGADSADIPFPEGYRTLDQVAVFLSHYPNNRIFVEVYAAIQSPESDEASEGEPRYKDAKALAEARAEMIRRYLVEVKGLASSQLTARGEEISQEPEAESPDQQRVEITIFK